MDQPGAGALTVRGIFIEAGGTIMGAIIGSIIQNGIEVAVFVVIAWAGIMVGKNMAAKKAQGSKDTK
jgi:hypothetical protein